MESNNIYIQETDLKTLMFAVLHKWRLILLIAVMLAIIFGGYKAVVTYCHQNDAQVIQEEQEKYQVELDLYEKNVETYEKAIDNLKTDITNQQEYLEKSVLMNMSAYDVWEAKTDLFVKTDYVIMPNMVYQNVDYTNTILSMYQSALTSTEFLDSIATKSGVELRYLKEVVEVSTNNYVITIRVRNKDEKSAKALLNEILNKVDSAHDTISENIGEHTVSVVNRSVGSLVDLALADTQKTQLDRLTQLGTSLENKQKELEELEAPEQIADSMKISIKTGVKYALLGGVLGACTVIFIVCVAFQLSDKMYSDEELRHRYKVKVLGVLPSGKRVNAVDAWLNGKEGRTNRPEELEYGLIAANICNYAEEAKSLLVVGTTDEDTIQIVAEKLAAELTDYMVIIGGNMLQNIDALNKLPEADGVILVEQCKVSAYGSIALELEKARDLLKPVIGCVVID